MMDKILISGCEIADNIKSFSEALKKGGRRADTYCFARNIYYLNNDYTFNLELPRMIEKSKYISFLYGRFSLFWGFLRVFAKYDVFVFVWSKTFLPLNVDLFILRAFGKKTVMFNCGDDVRYRPIQSKIDTEIFGFPKSFAPPQNLHNVRNVRSFLRPFFFQKVEEAAGCAIVSMRNQATFLKRPCYIFRFPMKGLVKEPKLPNKIPLILHAPTDREVKGTKYVLEAVARLKSKGLEFDFELIEGMSNEYTLSRIKQADILIDQPGPWLAKFAAEGLAAGCIVVGGNEPEYEGLEHDSPVIRFLPDGHALFAALKLLLEDQVLMSSVMDASFKYWQREYSPEAFCRFFSEVLSGEARRLSPLPNHRTILLKYASGSLERFLLRMFY